MNPNIVYTVEDIEEFLKINEELENSEEDQTLKKLLSVQNKISIFRNIDPQDLKAIVYNLSFKKFKFKEFILKQNEISDEVYFIIEGRCQVFYNQQKVGELGPGEVVGESGAIFKTTRSASVVCSSEHTTLLSFSIDENSMEFCAPALTTLYKNLASQMDAKLRDINCAYSKTQLPQI
jgi:CRP-like cAMP-binding protein